MKAFSRKRTRLKARSFLWNFIKCFSKIGLEHSVSSITINFKKHFAICITITNTRVVLDCSMKAFCWIANSSKVSECVHHSGRGHGCSVSNVANCYTYNKNTQQQLANITKSGSRYIAMDCFSRTSPGDRAREVFNTQMCGKSSRLDL